MVNYEMFYNDSILMTENTIKDFNCNLCEDLSSSLFRNNFLNK